MPPLFFYHTTDGGATWTQTELPTPEGLPAGAGDGLGDRCGIPQIALLPDQTAALSLRCFDFEEETSQAWLYTYDQSSATWQAQSLPEPAGVFSFLDAAEGWYLAADESQPDQNSRLYHTADGGAGWTTLAQVEGQGQPHLDFADGQNGWIALGYPPDRTLLHSTDGGATWTMLEPMIVQP
jgi:photosystem II stability/assembly factor-like uncharacterized protein